MKKLEMNTISNIVTKLWSIVAIYVFIPLYIRVLGETAYGLVSFFATLQATMNILGLGLSNTLKREFASGVFDQDNSRRKYKLLRSIETIYFVIGLIIIAICISGSPVIADKWLNIEDLDPNMVITVIGLMGISIALQMIANLYVGCLFGLEYQVITNIATVFWSILKSTGALVIIYLIKPNLIYFYAWHIVTDIIYLLFLRNKTIKCLQLVQKVTWNIKEINNIKTIWKYAAGILFISFIGLINKQLDKVVISKYLSVTELGAYTVATTLGGVCTIIPVALVTTVFPRFTQYATTCNSEQLNREFVSFNKISSIITACLGAYISFFSTPLIKLWTGSDIYVELLTKVGFFVIMAVALAEYQEMPYALALSYGYTKYNVLVGAIFIPIIFIATYFGIIKFGLLGAGVVYLIIMLTQTLLYQFLVVKKFLREQLFNIMVKQTLLPISFSLILAFISKKIVFELSTNTLVICVLAVLFGLIALCLMLFIFAKEELLIMFNRFSTKREKNPLVKK